MVRTVINVNIEDVEKRRQPSKHYVYVICVTWSDQTVCIIYRRYSQFFELQSKILDRFPIEGGSRNPADRIIPFLPGKILFGRSHIRRVALDRQGAIDKYCKGLINLPSHISDCKEVLSFFEAGPEDIQQFEKRRSSKKSAPVGNQISTPLLLEQYVAVDDYKKEASTETSLIAGSLVEVIEKNDTGWWFVSTDEGQGWVPSSYLEKIDAGEDERILHKANLAGQGEKFICSNNYTPQESDEVKLDKGALVEVIERNLDGWWLVRYNGQTGRAPATFLTRTDTIKAQRLLGKKAQPKVEMIPNAMSVSHMKKSQQKSNQPQFPVANQNYSQTSSANQNHPQASAANQALAFRLPAVNNNTPYKHSASDKVGETRPADKLGRPATQNTGWNSTSGWDDPHTSSTNVTGNQKSDWNSSSQGRIGFEHDQWNRSTSADQLSRLSDGSDDWPQEKAPPRKESVIRRERSLSVVSDDEDFIVHTDYKSEIPDGLTLKRGQVFKVLDKTNTGWWYLQGEAGEEGWAPSDFVEPHSRSSAEARSKPNRPPPPKFPRAVKEESPDTYSQIQEDSFEDVYENVAFDDECDKTNNTPTSQNEHKTNNFSTVHNELLNKMTKVQMNPMQHPKVPYNTQTGKSDVNSNVRTGALSARQTVLGNIKPNVPSGKPKVTAKPLIVGAKPAVPSKPSKNVHTSSKADENGGSVSVRNIKSMFENR